jgi:hypothetical protein
LPLFSPLSGAVVVAWQKRTALTIENNFQTGGNLNGKQQQSSHLKELCLIILLTVLKTLKVEFSQLGFHNGIYNK